MLLISLLSLANIILIQGHANIKFPPTRESKALSGDPIGFPLNMRPQGSCTNMQKGPVTLMKPGKHFLRISFNDGANHIGDCVVYLANGNAKGSNANYPGEKVGEMKDCGRSIHKDASIKGVDIPGAMEYTLPENPACGDDCVLIWSLTAVHTTPTEYYDGCADIRIDPSAEIDPKENEIPVVVDRATKRETPYDQYSAKSEGPLYQALVAQGSSSYPTGNGNTNVTSKEPNNYQVPLDTMVATSSNSTSTDLNRPNLNSEKPQIYESSPSSAVQKPSSKTVKRCRSKY